MTRILLIILFPVIVFHCYAQDTVALHKYLLHHRYRVNIDSGTGLNVLPDMMQDKKLFVLGEGGSHELRLYETLKPAILQQLAKLDLRYFFNESGRASAYIKNAYLHGDFKERPKGFESLFAMLDKEKNVLALHPDFMVIGIDFERG